MKEKADIAVIGAGFFGDLHTRVLSENPTVNLKAIVDVDPSRAKQIAERYRVERWYSSVDDLLAKQDFDAVTIATPEQYHKDPAVKIAKSGKHVFVEKPIAHTLADGRAIVEAAKKAGVKLTVGHVLRFDARYAQAKEHIANGEVGDIISVWARRMNQVATPKRVAGWSNPLFYLGVHDIDMMNWYLGSRVQSVYAEAASKLFESVGAPDVIWALIRFENGAVGSLEVNWSLPTTWQKPIESRMHVFGTKGAIFVDVVDSGLSVYSEAGATFPDTSHWPAIHGRVEGDLREEMAHFVDCILRGTQPIVTGDDGLRALEVCLAVIESYRTRKCVELPLQAQV